MPCRAEAWNTYPDRRHITVLAIECGGVLGSRMFDLGKGRPSNLRRNPCCSLVSPGSSIEIINKPSTRLTIICRSDRRYGHSACEISPARAMLQHLCSQGRERKSSSFMRLCSLQHNYLESGLVCLLLNMWQHNTTLSRSHLTYHGVSSRWLKETCWRHVSFQRVVSMGRPKCSCRSRSRRRDRANQNEWQLIL